MKRNNLSSNIYLKIESDNLTGSIKDRIAYRIIKDALEKKIINKNTIILEATSGNTGISIACISYILNLKCIIVMPKNTSIKKINLIKKYKGNVILVNGDMKTAVTKLNELKNIYKNHFTLDQFNNESCITEHYETTSKEIITKVNGNVDVFICGIGTGATFTGCARRLKEVNKNTICIGVLPFDKDNIIEGIGAGFIPKNLDLRLVDEIIYVSNYNALKYKDILAKTEHLYCGISSGAALYAGFNIAEKLINKNIVVILPDDENRYSYNKENI